MSVEKLYFPQKVEKKWYAFWQEQNFFHSQPNKKKIPYTVLMPPPNVTGVLHMGHVLNNTIQDILVRKARMEGKEACWIPGTDHASIATEAKVVAMLQKKGMSKKDMTREAFLQHAWQWKEKYGHIIFNQLKKLGISCDWSKARFTMDSALSKSVNQTFINLYEKGHIYRKKKMIHWDPQGKTALSDAEVIYRTTESKLYYIAYPIQGSQERIIIATTRPETIFGDVAICVHPKDQRYVHLKGKHAVVPYINRTIPILYDAYVDPDLGSGALKITPAHDFNDYQIGINHNLSIINIFNVDGTLNEQAKAFLGEDRFVVRKKIVKWLTEHNYLVKEERYEQNIGFSERTQAIVEPRISTQWFVNMKPLAKPAIDSVKNNTIQFYPAKFKNLYYAWMENIQDWCISRQLWWGHRIPAYYLKDGTIIVAKNIDEALQKAKMQTKNEKLCIADLKQDEDILDTWFSSWLWPITVFDGLEDKNNAAINYYYPTNDLVTAPEIIFFWVARMIMAGYFYKNQPTFRNVYFTGIVRDHKGRKMSKSLGNSPEPIALIEKYGADGVRAGMLFSAPAGNDLLFEEKYCEQGRNFANKMWNAFRLIQSWQGNTQIVALQDTVVIDWFDNKLQQVVNKITALFVAFRISEALLVLYRFFWDDFCACYLEMIKPQKDKTIAQDTLICTINFFETILLLLHPFMPFLTEEIWQNIKKRDVGASIMVSSWPKKADYDVKILQEVEDIFVLIGKIRQIKSKHQIKNKQVLDFYVDKNFSNRFFYFVEKLAYVRIIMGEDGVVENNLIRFGLKQYHFSLAITIKVNYAAEIKKLNDELVYAQNFLANVNKKLANTAFMAHAPEKIIAVEQQKKQDILEKIEQVKKHILLFTKS